jgi:DNA-binding protein
MQNYQKRKTIREIQEVIENCIQIQQGGRIKNYAVAAERVLSNHSKVVIRGKRIACNKVVSLVEILKRKNCNLVSHIEIYSENEIEEWIPIDEFNKDVIHLSKSVPCIKITLSS